MNTYHILNGDALADQLSKTTINQDFIIARECLIEGNVNAENISDFWSIRAEFMAETYKTSKEEYFSKTVSEMEKLPNMPNNSVVCLWFENDLFCQANMWFVISMLSVKSDLDVYRIFPVIENKDNIWKGFAINDVAQLEQAYASKVQFQQKDIELAKYLWAAYQNGDLNKLKEISKKESNCFHYLEEVCQAHIDRFPLDNTLGRPDKAVKELIDNNITQFKEVFSRFSEKEGIYGLGDLQFKNIFDRQIKLP